MTKKVFTNESLATFIEEIKSYINNKTSGLINSLNNYYTKTEIDIMELITVEDIDEICGKVVDGNLPQKDIDELMAQLQGG